MQKKDLLKMFAHLLCELPSENQTDKKLDLVLSKLVYSEIICIGNRFTTSKKIKNQN